MIKFFLLFFSFLNIVLAIEITNTDLPLEFDGINEYQIFSDTTKIGVAKLPIFANSEIGKYKVEIGKLKGAFKSSKDTIDYTFITNPYYDTSKQCFFIHLNENESIRQIPLTFSFSKEKILSPGTYLTQIPIKISKDNKTLLKKNITMFFAVKEQIEAKIYLEGELKEEDNMKIHFGEILGNIEKDLILSIKANTNIKVSITSKNNGRMILEGEEKEKYTPYYIPYTLQTKGEEISLLTKTTLLNKVFVPNMETIFSKIKFLLSPNMNKSFSGKYKDRVCITISSS